MILQNICKVLTNITPRASRTLNFPFYKGELKGLYKRWDCGNLQTCTNNESSEFSPFLKGRCPKDRGVNRGAYARQVSINGFKALIALKAIKN
jgi:hypothetical protein